MHECVRRCYPCTHLPAIYTRHSTQLDRLWHLDALFGNPDVGISADQAKKYQWVASPCHTLNDEKEEADDDGDAGEIERQAKRKVDKRNQQSQERRPTRPARAVAIAPLSATHALASDGLGAASLAVARCEMVALWRCASITVAPAVAGDADEEGDIVKGVCQRPVSHPEWATGAKDDIAKR